MADKMPKPVALKPDALTRLIRDLYVGNVELNLDRERDELALQAFGREFFGLDLTLYQLVKIGRGEARLVVRMTSDDTAGWLAYADDPVSNVRAAILTFIANNSGVYWDEIKSRLELRARDRVVLHDLERERLVTSNNVGPDVALGHRVVVCAYYVTTEGIVALAEKRC